MHALYKTTANWDGTAIAQDLAKLLTNDLNFSGYSTSCDKSGSYIITNIVSGGWSMWDASAGLYTYVITSTEANGTTPKYLRIVGSASSVTITAFGTWNPVTHTGTNATSGVSIYGLSVNANISTIVLWQTSAYIAIQVNSGGTWQMPGIWGCELDRSTTFTDYHADNSNSVSTIAGLGPAIGTYNNSPWGRMYGRTLSTTLTLETGEFYITALALTGSGSSNAIARNIDDSIGPYIISPTYIAGGGVYNPSLTDYGSQMMGTLRDILTCPYTGLLAPLDEVGINGTLYSILRYESKCAFLVPKV